MLTDSISRTKVLNRSRFYSILSAWRKIPVSAAGKLVIGGVLISSGLLAYWYLKGQQRNENTHQRPTASKTVQDAKFRLSTDCHYISASEADERLRAHQARLISPRLVSCGADCRLYRVSHGSHIEGSLRGYRAAAP